jgi:hypothetical protein
MWWKFHDRVLITWLNKNVWRAWRTTNITKFLTVPVDSIWRSSNDTLSKSCKIRTSKIRSQEPRVSEEVRPAHRNPARGTHQEKQKRIGALVTVDNGVAMHSVK